MNTAKSKNSTLLTPHEIFEYALRFDQIGSSLNEAVLLEKIEGDDIGKIFKANQELLKTLNSLDKAFKGRVKTVDEEIKKLLDGAKRANKVLDKATSGGDGMSSQKLMSKIAAFFKREDDPKATINAVLLLQSRAQELVEIIKFVIPKMITTLEKQGIDKSATDPVPDALGWSKDEAFSAMKSLVKEARPGMFKKIGNFFKTLNVNQAILNVDEKIDYTNIAFDILELKVSELFDIHNGVESIRTDKGGELKGILKDTQADLKPAGSGEAATGEAPSAEELGTEVEIPKEAEAEAEVATSDEKIKAAAQETAKTADPPAVALSKMIDAWADGLSPSAQKPVRAKNRLGDLKDIVGVALDDSAKAVEGEVAAAVQAWRDDHEEILIRSKRFAKKNFDELQNLIPRIAGIMLKKKNESGQRMTPKMIKDSVYIFLDARFGRAGVLAESPRWQTLAGILK